MGITARPSPGTAGYEKDLGNVVVEKGLVSRAAHLRFQCQPSTGKSCQGWRCLLAPCPNPLIGSENLLTAKLSI